VKFEHALFYASAMLRTRTMPMPTNPHPNAVLSNGSCAIYHHAIAPETLPALYIDVRAERCMHFSMILLANCSLG